jgi:hypothetical protein
MLPTRSILNAAEFLSSLRRDPVPLFSSDLGLPSLRQAQGWLWAIVCRRSATRAAASLVSRNHKLRCRVQSRKSALNFVVDLRLFDLALQDDRDICGDQMGHFLESDDRFQTQ